MRHLIISIAVAVFISRPDFTFAQSILVQGEMTDNENNKLPGVNVLVKGTPIGTVADNAGQFKISMPQGSSILLFFYIGYKTSEQEIRTDDKSEQYMIVTLVKDIRKNKRLKSSAKVVSKQ